MARSALLNVMVGAAHKAGRSLSRDYGEVQNLQVSLKGPGDYVSQADRKAEEIIHSELSRARPSYSFLMEERGFVEGDDEQHRWIIDPLDGTTNFLHGIPLFAISIALERQGQIVAAVIYNPAMDELYVAERGGGAFMNDRRLRVAARRKAVDCVFTTGIPHLGRPNHGRALIDMKNVMADSSGVRAMGSAALALAYVASGRVDGYFEDSLMPWDTAAGILMVREAGGFVTDREGGSEMLDKGSVVAGNELIHGALLSTLRKPASA